ncbi:HAMP domain-containing histidine kinase [Paeniglutamicibacter sp. ABSL32-1]|uniref:sensor histidine kinase n=1 Tax=Paeniglutamicibacter quisquiliarum TaxID=2849498 RepID=UPI001C2D5A1D|nr:HAMP domain-containing sensor histidine kinase [Paeniglutamicibacter quisquiliarum]MBV1780973.1 HAMP domain-containing histidine kinase [Paeniglutamicibacter quisquiliarum]
MTPSARPPLPSGEPERHSAGEASPHSPDAPAPAPGIPGQETERAPLHARLGQRLGRLPLQRKLLLALIGSLALICTVIGLLLNAGMRQSLAAQLHEQLEFASDRAASYSAQNGRETSSGPLFAPGQASGTLNARIVSGYLFSGAVLDSKTGERKDITDADVLPLTSVKVDAPPVVHHLSIGDYMLSAQQDPGSGGILITGLPMAPTERTLASLGILTITISLAGLIAIGLVGSMIIRRSLAPLQRVSAVASSVANAELESGTAALEARVPPEDSIPGTESGEVGRALNALLDNVGAAFAVREASEAQMRQFVADASHELRTPLSAIRGYTELISATEHFSDDGQRSLNRVLEQSTRMSSLVENLLLLARLDEKHQIKKAPVDLGKLATDITEDFAITAPAHHWIPKVPDIPLVVSGDAAALRRVITNLLANARKHTSEGNTVTVGVHRDAASHQAVLRVADTGEGIAPDFLPLVFERFTRADGARSGADGTTGLGLPIAKAIVESHDGSITVSSVPGNTVFEVRLPLPLAVPPKPLTPPKAAKA